MSVCIVHIEPNGENLHFASDSRCAIEMNGVNYYLNDNQKKIFEIDNQLIYISGYSSLAQEVINFLLEKNIKDPKKIAEIMKKKSSQYFKDRPKPKNPHYLQAVIPFMVGKKWIVAYIDSANQFIFDLMIHKKGKDFLFSIGSGGKIIFNHISKNLNKKPIKELLVEGLSQAANELCGGKLIYYLLKEGHISHIEEILVPDQKPLRQISRVVDSGQIVSAGDGMFVRPDGYESARAYQYKYNGGYDILYFSSNVAHERSLKFTDEGILVKSEYAPITLESTDLNLNVSGRAKINHASGTVIEIDATGQNVKIVHQNGSYYELTPTGRKEYIVGNAETVCTGNFKVTASRIDLN